MGISSFSGQAMAILTLVLMTLPLLRFLLDLYENREPGLKYKIKSVFLFNYFMEQYPKLSFAYKGKLMKNIMMTRIIIFNKGSKTIEHTQLANEKGVDINVQGQILDVFITGKISNGCEFALKKNTKDKRKFMLAFHHMKRKNAVLVEILHRSDSSFFKSPTLTAAGAQVREISKNQSFGNVSYISLIYTIAMILLFLAGVSLFLESKTGEKFSEWWLNWSEISLAVAVAGVTVLGIMVILISVSTVNSFLFNKKWISDLIKQFNKEMSLELKEEKFDKEKNAEDKIFRLIVKRLNQKFRTASSGGLRKSPVKD